MTEVLDRRFNEYKEGTDESFKRLPDLILLDGAKGQIGAVLPIMQKHGINIPIFGMVKDSKHRTRAIATTGGDIAIKSTRGAFKLVTDIQDEVHRFAISYHKTLQSRGMIKSELLDINGVGKARATALIKHFGSMKKIREADVGELAKAKGMNMVSAEAVYNYFHK